MWEYVYMLYTCMGYLKCARGCATTAGGAYRGGGICSGRISGAGNRSKIGGDLPVSQRASAFKRVCKCMCAPSCVQTGRGSATDGHLISRTRRQFKFNSDVVRESPGWKGGAGSHSVKVTHTVRHVQAAVAAPGQVSALHLVLVVGDKLLQLCAFRQG